MAGVLVVGGDRVGKSRACYRIKGFAMCITFPDEKIGRKGDDSCRYGAGSRLYQLRQPQSQQKHQEAGEAKARPDRLLQTVV